MSKFEYSVPVLIVGGGACGCVAALAARELGADVLLIEQDARPAGTTSMSQGLICAAGTRPQAAHGVDDSPDRLFEDIMAKTRRLADPVIARAIADGAGPCINWMIEQQGLPWELDIGFRAAYGHSCLRVHGWRGHGGTDMIQLLHQKLAEQGVDVLLQARLAAIVTNEAGRVLGIEVERPDGTRERVGCETLIVASGGFAANHNMVAKWMPEAAAARHNGHEGNRGDGILLAERIGAAVGDMGSYQGYAMLTDPQGITVPPGVLVEGGILINRLGERFVDELADIAGMVHPVMAQPEGIAWVVFDERIEQACAYMPETLALIEINAAKVADTLPELAARIRVDPDALTASIADAVAAHAQGTTDLQGRLWEDDSPPLPRYRALKVCGAIYHTQGGLQVDGAARVLRADGTALPNLFAGGGAARGVSGPSSWGYLPAMGLCAAVTLGRIAGQNAARQALGQATS